MRTGATRCSVGAFVVGAAIGGLRTDATAAPAPPTTSSAPGAQPSALPEGIEAEPTTTTAPSEGLDPLEVSGWVIFGLGGASFVAGVVTGILAIEQSKQLDAGCPDARCPPAWHGGVDAFHAYRASSTATLAAAGALGIAGVALLVAAPSDTPAATGSTSALRLVVRPASLALTGSF